MWALANLANWQQQIFKCSFHGFLGTYSIVSDRMKIGRTVKLSRINAESTVGKFLKLFAACNSLFPHFPAVVQSVSPTLLYIVKIISASVSHIFLNFHCLQVLDPKKANFE